MGKDGEASVVKHYAPGRFAREMQEMASDSRTAIGGDDGKNTGLFMFVADEEKDLSAGTIYAAKVTQTSAENGGSFTLEWTKLGHATDDEIQAIIDSGIKFSDVFDFLPADTTEDTTGYTKVTTYMGTEWLRLKEGMEQAAAFLETRRYAALLGATTEFSKMEYIAFNKKDRKFYLTISRVEARMADTEGDIRVARNDGGIILEMSTAKDQKDTEGNPIDSELVGTDLVSIPELVGGWPIPEELDLADGVDDGKDAEGNQCVQDKLCGPDNLRYVDSIRTLFLGEDTSRRNNNYVWAFNIDTRKLSRILSVPMGAEATGLMVAPNYGGHAYIMSNFQHPGEGGLPNYLGTDKDESWRPSTSSGTSARRSPSATSAPRRAPCQPSSSLQQPPFDGLGPSRQTLGGARLARQPLGRRSLCPLPPGRVPDRLGLRLSALARRSLTVRSSARPLVRVSIDVHGPRRCGRAGGYPTVGTPWRTAVPLAGRSKTRMSASRIQAVVPSSWSKAAGIQGRSRRSIRSPRAGQLARLTATAIGSSSSNRAKTKQSPGANRVW